MTHLLQDALVRKLRARISALEERMDVPWGLFAAELLRDHPLSPYTQMNILAGDLDVRLVNMDVAIQGLWEGVCAHQDKEGVSLTSIQDTIRQATQLVREELVSLRGEVGQLRAAIEEHSLVLMNQNMEQSIYALEQLIGPNGQAQGLGQGIEVIQVDSDNDGKDMSVCSNQVDADERSLSSTDHHL
ncbi:unnamed protein product [Citrullus colocynthis]|uniref:Uncharacterized protein n=1 Tax=Citrullus colocynthis TaxID=252529 RepID=A0ABP0YRW2_9ROSI